MPVPAPSRRRRRLPRAVMFGVVLLNWETQARIDEFVPGKHDRSDQLLIPEKLYERAPETDTLLSAFDGVVGGTGSLAIRLLAADVGRYPLDRKLVKLLLYCDIPRKRAAAERAPGLRRGPSLA
jgi:hypothetical protein